MQLRTEKQFNVGANFLFRNSRDCLVHTDRVFVTDLASEVVLKDADAYDTLQCYADEEYYTSYTNGVIRVWDIRTGDIVRTLPTDEVICKVIATSHFICKKSGYYFILDISKNTLLYILDDVGNEHVFNCNGNALVAHNYGTTVHIVPNIHSATCFTQLKIPFNIATTCLMDDLLITGTVEGTIYVWNMHSRECIYTLKLHKSYVYKLTMAGLILCSVCIDDCVCIWDLNTGTLMNSFVISSDICISGSMQIFGTYLAMLSSYKHHFIIYDYKTGECMYSRRFESKIHSFEFYKDRFAMVVGEKTIFGKFWEIRYSVFALSWVLGDGDLVLARRLLSILTP